jgi:dethiobiotin synthetase
MVVGLRLGCINHALLTMNAINNDKIRPAGWIINSPDPRYEYAKETIHCLKSIIRIPLLGVLPFTDGADAAALGGCLDIAPLLE